MTLLKQAQGPQGNMLISCLVVARLVPTTLSSFAGGILADTRDRRRIMLVLDVVGAVVALCYLKAQTSVIGIYICATLQSTLSGLYQPSRSALLPLLVHRDYLEKANEISTILWSLSAAVGSSLGGFVVDRFDTSVCFATDSLLYIVSAAILAMKVQGDFCVTNTNKVAKSDGWLWREVGSYVVTNQAAPFLLIKVSGALLFGASDVIAVTFSQVDGVLDAQRVGWMFTSVGAGCLLGPLLVPEGRSYAKSCVASFFALGVGYGFIGLSNAFWAKCAWTILRAAGASILWVDSSILLQKATPSSLLGRIASIDFALATLGESASAVMAGLLQDNGLTANGVAYLLSGLGFTLAAIWSTVLICCKRLRSNGNIHASVELEPLKETTVPVV
jgi:hypothetical protein